MRVAFFICALSFNLVLSACTTTPEPRVAQLSVDSISDGTASPKFFEIEPASTEVDPDDLRFKEFARFTENALRVKGFKHAVGKPNLIVTLAYGVGEPEKSLITHAVTTYTPPAPGTTTTISNSNGQTVGTLQTQPTNNVGQFGTNYVSAEITKFTRHIVITAYEPPQSNGTPKALKRKMKWQTKIISTGVSYDLRDMFPMMLVGAMRDISTNTGVRVSRYYALEDDDARICIIRLGEQCDTKQYRKHSD